jgi:two-component sensor histidine kinase
MTGTLQALSAAQTLVTPRPSQDSSRPSTTLQEVLEGILAPYAHGSISLSGHDIEVGPQAMNILALVFHELATNAAKYGALSVDNGAIAVAWEGDSQRVLIKWTERNGPPILAPPTSSGFGTLVACFRPAARTRRLKRANLRGHACALTNRHVKSSCRLQRHGHIVRSVDSVRSSA